MALPSRAVVASAPGALALARYAPVRRHARLDGEGAAAIVGRPDLARPQNARP
jgi:hypothetical protein